jgi:hypothetical protein
MRRQISMQAEPQDKENLEKYNNVVHQFVNQQDFGFAALELLNSTCRSIVHRVAPFCCTSTTVAILAVM